MLLLKSSLKRCPLWINRFADAFQSNLMNFPFQNGYVDGIGQNFTCKSLEYENGWLHPSFFSKDERKTLKSWNWRKESRFSPVNLFLETNVLEEYGRRYIPKYSYLSRINRNEENSICANNRGLNYKIPSRMNWKNYYLAINAQVKNSI